MTIGNILITLMTVFAITGCTNQKVVAAQIPQNNPSKEYLVENVDKSLIAPTDPSVRLALNAMPPVRDYRTHNAIVNYSDAAKAWWVTSRCKNIGDAERKDFEDRLANFTNLMKVLLASEFATDFNSAAKYTGIIQMRSLEAMSANKFYGCSGEANKIWELGYKKTKMASPSSQ